MCLAIPSKVINVQENMGIIDVGGVKRSVSLMLLENVKVGDYVLVHAGFAMQILDKTLALESLKILKEAIMNNPDKSNV